MSSSIRFAGALILPAIAVVACSRAENQPKVPLSATASTAGSPVRDALPPEERAALDLGNTRYRAGNYADALTAYRKAAAAAPNDAAPYFGIYMTAKKVGNTALADSANTAIAARNGASLMLSDSSMKELHSTRPASAPDSKAASKAR